MKFAANLSMMYPHLPFLERFAAAAGDGFGGVEHVSPYEFAVADIQRRLQENQLTQVLFNLPAGDWAGGERGVAIFADRVAEFKDGVATALRYAQELGCAKVNCLAGILPPDADPHTAHATLVANLRWAADELGRGGVKLLLEPVNSRDVPGFFVDTVPQALAIIDEASHPNLYLQYDVYHAQVTQGDLLATYQRNQHLVQHIQFADHPGRHEPGTGEVNFDFLLPAIAASGYEGWFGAEYVPSAGDDMSWLTHLRARMR